MRERLEAEGIAPAPKRSPKTTWKEFIQSDLAVLAGIDFFTVEVLTWRGLVMYYKLFFFHLESRVVSLAGITRRPNQAWMQQMARNATGETWGFLGQRQYALRDRDTKFCSFPGNAEGWRHKADSTPGAEPQFEFVCGKVGAIGKGGVSIETGAIQRSLVAADSNRIHRFTFTRKETTKATRTRSYSHPSRLASISREVEYVAASALADY